MEIKKTGTTTIGIIAKDSVVIATEMKSTMGYLVASKKSKKIYQLDDHIGMTIAGVAGDAQYLARLLRAQYKLYRLERGPITIRGAAHLLANILQGSKYYPFMNLLILAGYDTAPRVYSIDPVGGFDSQDNFYSTGSGSPFAYGVLEAEYKEGLSTDEAIALVVRAIKSAIERDIGSGGSGIAVAVIDKNGFRKLSEQQVNKYAS